MADKDTYQAKLNVRQNYFPKFSELAQDQEYRFGMSKVQPDYDDLDLRTRQIVNARASRDVSAGKPIGASKQDVESYLSQINYQGTAEDDKKFFNFLIGRGVGLDEMSRMFNAPLPAIKNRYNEVLSKGTKETEDNPFLFMQAVDAQGNPFEPSNITKKQGVYYIDMPNVSLSATDDSQSPQQVAAQVAADKARFQTSQAEQQRKAQAEAMQSYAQVQADQQAQQAQQAQLQAQPTLQSQQGLQNQLTRQGLMNQIIGDSPLQTYGTTQRYLGQDLNNIQLSNVKSYLQSLDDGSYASLVKRMLGF